VEERDHRDSTRPIAPLRQATDALEIDSSDLTIDEVVDRIVTTVQHVERAMSRSSG
jgi:cytidylate kinase